MYKRILVPLDGSKLAEETFPYARELAGRLDLDLDFLHVADTIESQVLSLVPMAQAYVDKIAEIVRDQIHQVKVSTGEKGTIRSVEVRSKVVTGLPAEEILKYAEENPIDIILMATHGASGVRRWAIGSVAYQVLHASKLPVLLVRSGIPQQTVYDKWPQRTILVPLDGSELAESALPHAESLAKQRGLSAIEILLLNVCEPDLIPRAAYNLQPNYRPDLPLKYEDYVQQETARIQDTQYQYLEKQARTLRSAGVKVKTKVLVGNAAEEIIKYASQDPFQVIVMASHGRSGFKLLVFGSVAEKVLLQTNTPVLIVRPKS